MHGWGPVAKEVPYWWRACAAVDPTPQHATPPGVANGVGHRVLGGRGQRTDGRHVSSTHAAGFVMPRMQTHAPALPAGVWPGTRACSGVAWHARL